MGEAFSLLFRPDSLGPVNSALVLLSRWGNPARVLRPRAANSTGTGAWRPPGSALPGGPARALSIQQARRRACGLGCLTVDNVINLRYIEGGIDLGRAIDIVKMRNSDHASALNSVTISDHGLQIGNAISGSTGRLGWSVLSSHAHDTPEPASS